MIEQGNYYEFGGNTWVLRTDFLRLKREAVERMTAMDREISDLKKEIEVWKALQPDQDLKAKLVEAEKENDALRELLYFYIQRIRAAIDDTKKGR